jgi:hypothetical protein
MAQAVKMANAKRFLGLMRDEIDDVCGADSENLYFLRTLCNGYPG